MWYNNIASIYSHAISHTIGGQTEHEHGRQYWTNSKLKSKCYT